MKRFSILFIAFAAMIMLSACASKMEGERLSVDGLTPADTSNAQGSDVVNLMAEPGAVESQPLAAPQNYEEVARVLSNNNVQMYGPNGTVSDAVRPLPKSFSTPSVEIFPLDQAMADTLNMGQGLGAPLKLSGYDGAPLTPMPNDGDARTPMPKVKPDFAKTGKAAVYFASSSSELDMEALDTVENVAWAQAHSGQTPLQVNGYASTKAVITDPIRRKMINLKLSMDRAYSVAKALIDRGVEPNLIRTTGWGETQPAYLQGMDPESASRRVEISRASR